MLPCPQAHSDSDDSEGRLGQSGKNWRVGQLSVVSLFWSLGWEGMGSQSPDLRLHSWNLEPGIGQREPSL